MVANLPSFPRSCLFQSFFETIFQQVIADAKAQGVHDAGVVDVYYEKLQKVVSREMIRVCGKCLKLAFPPLSCRLSKITFSIPSHPTTGLPVTLHTIHWDRGIPWERAVEMKEEHLRMLRERNGEDAPDAKDNFDDGRGTGKSFPGAIASADELCLCLMRHQTICM